ncbi:hypothetical protein I7X12_09825 [Halosimplex litoreum]|uniref:Uncharacterized protein n=1 Tax=Halosimplex litoreum TaxID=1198301 RepID=A0A7U3WB80_9EURY|nr:hypothetical protein [Halosimplex litoreum]QPV64875.1 hypothetical protein I7X12_09825 [Halosimplex litoreum]
MSTRRSVARARPLGVTIICVLGGFGALFGLLGSLVVLGTNPLLGVVVMALSAGQLAAMVGLWGLHTWGWYLAVAFYGIGGLLDIVTVSPIGFAISAIVVLYLFAKRPLFH